jgi:hypothetical protein
MDENPYKAPAGESPRCSPAASFNGLIETLAIASVWTFNAVVVGLILLTVGVAILGISAAWQVR